MLKIVIESRRPYLCSLKCYTIGFLFFVSRHLTDSYCFIKLCSESCTENRVFIKYFNDNLVLFKQYPLISISCLFVDPLNMYFESEGNLRTCLVLIFTVFAKEKFSNIKLYSETPNNWNKFIYKKYDHSFYVDILAWKLLNHLYEKISEKTIIKN